VIDHLDSDQAELVMNACTQRGHYFMPTRQFGQRYSFIREIELGAFEDNPFNWDVDNRVLEAVMLSRLIVDNNASTQYAARIVKFADGERQVFYHGPSEFDHVYSLWPDERNWLDEAEGAELRDLLAAYWAVAWCYWFIHPNMLNRERAEHRKHEPIPD